MLYDDTPSMFFTVNKEGQVLSVNHYGAECLGYTASDLIDCSIKEVVYPDDRAFNIEKIADAFEIQILFYIGNVESRHDQVKLYGS